jgi:hypothetical protein
MTRNAGDCGRSLRPLVTTRTRYRAAQRRLCSAYGSRVGRRQTVSCFDRSVVDLGRLGLSGTGLIVAAEHMAGNQLRSYQLPTPANGQHPGAMKETR